MTPTISHAGVRPVPAQWTKLDFYCNPALDALYDRNWRQRTRACGSRLFVQIHQIYLTQFPFITLYSPSDLYDRAQGDAQLPAQSFAGETVNIWEWWCDNGKC